MPRGTCLLFCDLPPSVAVERLADFLFCTADQRSAIESSEGIPTTTSYMRKLIPFLALTLHVTGACAQGIVWFSNSAPSTTPIFNDYSPETGNLVVGTQWAAQLYYGPSASSLTAHTAAPSLFRPAGTSLPGTWRSDYRTLTGGGVGVPVYMQVRVWNLDLFPTYEAAVAGEGLAGQSTVFIYTQQVSSPSDPSEVYMQDAAGNPLFESFRVVPIPEPGVGLLAIPAIALVAWQYRRRRFISSRN
jgi:hypothetical protein